ncbi:MAG TPA: 3-deoxy-manno-octulosonate cytidylyltransferase [Bacteroidota bacterium]|nr:3-deoxy-manno-octulosonate cytidylyltransferase [Bacteroidota bacterium]
MSIVGIIPARYGSTRLSAKPLIDLCGKPMIQHVYERALKAGLLQSVVVATDHQSIADTVAGFGGTAVMTPAELPTGSDRIAHVASSLDKADIIVNIQGDEPLIVPGMIDEAIRGVTEDPSAQVGTLIREITSAADLSNPGIVKVVVAGDGRALYFSRSPIPHIRDVRQPELWHTHHRYFKHIGLYVYRKSVLLQFARWGEGPLERAERLEQLRFLEHNIAITTRVTKHDSVPVDTPEDADRVRAILKQN